jgi:multiple sugar transport system substrate-binding protein
MDMTWDEFFDKAREMKGKLGSKVYGANDMSAIYESFMYYVLSEGEVMYKDNKLGYKDETLKEWLTMWDKARTEGLVPPANETASYQVQSVDPNKEPVTLGTVPIEGPLFTAHYAAFDGMLPGKLDMVTMPRTNKSTKKNGSVLETASFLGISAKTKYPKDSAMFVDFMVNSTEAADILESERGIPDNKQTREYLSKRFTEKENKMLAMLQHVEKSDPSWYDGGPKSAGAVGKQFEQIIQKQQFGKASIDEVIAEFRKEANKVFEKNN